MNKLITGGAGYIGTVLSKKLDGAVVYDLINGDNILDSDKIEEKMAGVDICYHLAAVTDIEACELDPSKAIETNVIGTLVVANAAIKNNVKVVFASSFATYDQPHTIYAMTKTLGEKIVLQYNGIVCRIANVFGGDGFLEKKNTVISRLMKGTFSLQENGRQRRDFIHVNDVAQKLVEASKYAGGTILNVCSGKETSINELFELSRQKNFPDNLRRSP